jgi:hypothetical protein
MMIWRRRETCCSIVAGDEAGFMLLFILIS